MKEINLQKPLPRDTKNPYVQALSDELTELNRQSGRIYRSYVSAESSKYIFTTTSKEVHLILGTFGEKGLKLLGELLKQELIEGNCSEVVLLGGKGGDAFLVMLPHFDRDGEHTFYLSQVR